MRLYVLLGISIDSETLQKPLTLKVINKLISACVFGGYRSEVESDQFILGVLRSPQCVILDIHWWVISLQAAKHCGSCSKSCPN